MKPFIDTVLIKTFFEKSYIGLCSVLNEVLTDQRIEWIYHNLITIFTAGKQLIDFICILE